ncbi:FG-GAP and VCBS repeat-containing protein [Streptomyces sp. NPDC058374]|uniref:FG-GAP and VCBS repeat-containing protein n=1 Tax=unclassified Streptomyces TaxID=2593676 RepID=UPI0036674E2B
MRPPRTATAAALVAAVLAAPLLTAPQAAAAPAGLSDDFDGDGHRDLVLLGGTHGKDGRVTVVYGSAKGPATGRVQLLHQDSPGIPGAVEAGDDWGFAATTADLDRDGYADLAVASPGEDVGAVPDRGGLTVVWGGPKGLGTGTVFHSDVQPVNGHGDRYGLDVTSGDFDGDGHPDLVGISNSPAGALWLKGPFTRTGEHGGSGRLGDAYGYLSVSELTAGRPAADRPADLHMLGDDLGDDKGPAFSAFVHQGGPRFAEKPARVVDTPDDGGGETGGNARSAVADFDADGHLDLAVGRGTENTDGGAGSVVVHYGGPKPRTQTITQDTAGVPGAVEKGDLFGGSVAAGDMDGDGYPDLAAGSPGEDLGKVKDAGAVTVLKGSPAGLTGKGAQAYDQDTAGVAGAVEANDQFGTGVRLADHTGDGRADLLVDTNEQIDNTRWGMVHLLKGSASGITGTGSAHYTVNTLKLAAYEEVGGPFAD